MVYITWGKDRRGDHWRNHRNFPADFLQMKKRTSKCFVQVLWDWDKKRVIQYLYIYIVYIYIHYIWYPSSIISWGCQYEKQRRSITLPIHWPVCLHNHHCLVHPPWFLIFSISGPDHLQCAMVNLQFMGYSIVIYSITGTPYHGYNKRQLNGAKNHPPIWSSQNNLVTSIVSCW